jgi:hypothetical protein
MDANEEMETVIKKIKDQFLVYSISQVRFSKKLFNKTIAEHCKGKSQEFINEVTNRVKI